MVWNFCTKSFHEVMESEGWLVNQCLALSPSESRNNLSLSAFSVTPLYLTVSHDSCHGRVMRNQHNLYS